LLDKNIDCILCAFDGTSSCEGRLGSYQASGGLFGIRIRTRVVARKYHKSGKIKAQHSCWLPTACLCNNSAHYVLYFFPNVRFNLYWTVDFRCYFPPPKYIR